MGGWDTSSTKGDGYPLGIGGRTVGMETMGRVVFPHGYAADLQPDGRLMENSASNGDDGFSTFFSETGSGKHVPRSLYVSYSRSNVTTTSLHYRSTWSLM
jgi:hypothetical protein